MPAVTFVNHEYCCEYWYMKGQCLGIVCTPKGSGAWCQCAWLGHGAGGSQRGLWCCCCKGSWWVYLVCNQLCLRVYGATLLPWKLQRQLHIQLCMMRPQWVFVFKLARKWCWIQACKHVPQHFVLCLNNLANQSQWTLVMKQNFSTKVEFEITHSREVVHSNGCRCSSLGIKTIAEQSRWCWCKCLWRGRLGSQWESVG